MIFNLTQHKASSDQLIAGVVEPSEEIKKKIKDLLTFYEIPDPTDMSKRATELTEIVRQSGYQKAMIGGAPFFMSHLEKALLYASLQPLYAFSKRVSLDNADGSKTSVFKHLGFVRA